MFYQKFLPIFFDCDILLRLLKFYGNILSNSILFRGFKKSMLHGPCTRKNKNDSNDETLHVSECFLIAIKISIGPRNYVLAPSIGTLCFFFAADVHLTPAEPLSMSNAR